MRQSHDTVNISYSHPQNEGNTDIDTNIDTFRLFQYLIQYLSQKDGMPTDVSICPIPPVLVRDATLTLKPSIEAEGGKKTKGEPMRTEMNVQTGVKKKGTGINRRDFLKGAFAAGAVSAGAALVGCGGPSDSEGTATTSPLMTAETFDAAPWSFEIAPDPIADSEIVETHSSEVIIIGSGVSGLMTAASVINFGGTCILFSAGTKPVSRGGSNHAVGTKTQVRLGVDYTPENTATFFQNEIARQGYRVDQRKWWKWINHSGESMDWVTDLMETAGYTTTLELPYTDPNGTFTVPCGAHNFYGPEIDNSANFGEPLLTDTLHAYIVDNGGEVYFNTKAEYLMRDNDTTGKVSAVIATNKDGNYVKFEGSKAIVMATGDFSGNPDMMAKYCTSFKDFVTVAGDDYDAEFQFGGLMPGDGHKMGLWVGAAWQHTQPCAPMIGWYGFPAPESDMNHPGILLNTEGQRFMNEDSTSVYAGYAIQGQTNHAVYSVWDANFAYQFDTWNALGVNMDYLGLQPQSSAEKAAEFEANVKSGTFVKGETIEEVLSQLEGIDIDTALKTIENYNAQCAAGRDDEYHKNPIHMKAIETGPFYGATNTIGPAQFLCVLGGLRTNENMQVLDEDNAPIEGLYNVGTMVGDTFGTFYNFRVPGQNLGMNCITHPYLLGKALAS